MARRPTDPRADRYATVSGQGLDEADGRSAPLVGPGNGVEGDG